MFTCPAAEDFFRAPRPDDWSAPSAGALASRMPWQEIEAQAARAGAAGGVGAAGIDWRPVASVLELIHCL